jgi:hypothetical protein
MKALLALFVGLICLLLCAGCTSPGPGNATPTVTPTVTATPAPGTFPLVLTGTGTMEKNITLPASRLFVVKMDCPGDAFVPFFADISSKDLYQILTRSTGSYNSSQAFSTVNTGEYTLRIVGFGDWTATISHPEKDTSASLPLTLQGMGDTTTSLIQIREGNYTLKYNVIALEGFGMNFYNESGGLIFDPTGQRLEGLFINDPCAPGVGTKEVLIPETGYYLIDIRTNGFWDLTLG